MAPIPDFLLENVATIAISMYTALTALLIYYWRERKRREEVQELAWRNEELAERLSKIAREINETSSRISESRITFNDLNETQKHAISEIIDSYEEISEKSTYDIVIEVNKEDLDSISKEGDNE